MMGTNQDAPSNYGVYRELHAAIAATYPAGRFVAIHERQVVADGATFEDLKPALQARGLESRDCLVVQAGVEYPETAVILTA